MFSVVSYYICRRISVPAWLRRPLYVDYRLGFLFCWWPCILLSNRLFNPVFFTTLSKISFCFVSASVINIVTTVLFRLFLINHGRNSSSLRIVTLYRLNKFCEMTHPCLTLLSLCYGETHLVWGNNSTTLCVFTGSFQVTNKQLA